MYRTVILALAVVLGSCGDYLAGAAYYGQPLITISGDLFVVIDSQENLKVALFWERRALNDELEQSVQVATEFPAHFTVNVYAPPPDSTLQAIEGGSGSIGVGWLLVYHDENQDGQLNFGEPLAEKIVGGTARYRLLYTPDVASGGILRQSLSAGFHLVKVNQCSEGTAGWYESIEMSTNITVDVDNNFALFSDLDCDNKNDGPCLDAWQGYQDANEATKSEALAAYNRCVDDNTGPLCIPAECNPCSALREAYDLAPPEDRDLALAEFRSCVAMKIAVVCQSFCEEGL